MCVCVCVVCCFCVLKGLCFNLDSNQGPLDLQSNNLPTELLQFVVLWTPVKMSGPAVTKSVLLPPVPATVDGG